MHIVLTDREAQFMEVLWEHGPSTVAEVLAQLDDDPAYTTVLSILRNLESKGYVGPSKDGRAHRYAPLVTRDAARRSALRILATRFFKGSTQLLLTHLVADQKLSEDDVKHIKQLLAQQKKKVK